MREFRVTRAGSGGLRARMAAELLVIVKHDCPVCVQLLPALDAAAASGAPVHIVSQSSAGETAELAGRLGLRAIPDVDVDLALSQRYDPDAVPAVLLVDGAVERGRVEGIDRRRLEELAAAAGTALQLDGLPEHRPGCASRTRDPLIAPRLAARAARANGHIRSRSVIIGALEDPFEALFERGVTDGLPVVPPTPERVVTMLGHTRRHPQDVVATVPPYGGVASVEKVAVNAVMAGCPGETLPIVLAAVEAACDPAFALHGLVATTHAAGPTIVVSGQLAAKVGMNSGGNCLGQGSRANLTIGRALQLVVRNIGGGRPGEEDRAAHGQMGKLASCFAERSDGSPFSPLSVDRGFGLDDTTVTLVATEAPRIIIDQLARTPQELCVSLATALDNISHPRARLVWDALLVLGPEHARVFAEAGWDRERVRTELFTLTRRRAAELARGADGCAEGLPDSWLALFNPAGDGSVDPEALVPKFAAADRILVVSAGGDAGLFSMVYGTWVSGEIGSTPTTRSVAPWT